MIRKSLVLLYLVAFTVVLSISVARPTYASGSNATYEIDRLWGVKRVQGLAAYYNGQRGAGVKVAIIDTGVDCYGSGADMHPDLKSSGGVNACIGGWNFKDNNGNYSDSNGHGTAMAGIVAARLNNQGIVGVAPEASLYVLKIETAGGSGDKIWTDFANAIQWAIDNSANIIVTSLGVWEDSWDWPSPAKKAEVEGRLQAAWDAGILIVASAGNANRTPVAWPARNANVIAVTGINRFDERLADLFAYGSGGSTPRDEDVELTAPGFALYVPWTGQIWVTKYGTSFSAPHAAGVAAVIWNTTTDQNSNGRKNDEVRQRLRNEGEDIGDSGWDVDSGYGIPVADTSRVFPDLSSSLAIMGAWVPGLGDPTTTTATIEWRDEGSVVKTTTKTITYGETTLIYVPNELSGYTNAREVTAVIYGQGKPLTAVAMTSDTYPNHSHAYRGMQQANWQRTYGTTLYAPLIYIDEHTSVRFRFTAAERAPGSGNYDLKFTFRDANGTIINAFSPDDVLGREYEEQENPKRVITLSDAEVPWGRDVSVEVEVRSGYRLYDGDLVGVVETFSDSGKLSSYPMVSSGSNDGYLPRLMHGYQSWFTSVTFMNLGGGSATVQLTYYPDGGGTPTTYQATVPSNGVATLPDPGQPYPGTGTEGSGKITVTTGQPVIAIARTMKYENKTRGDNLVFMGISNNRAWQAINMWNYYGWYCATPLMNVDSTQRRLRTNFRWPTGSWLTDAWADPWNKYAFMNTGIPANTIAGAEGLTFDTTQVAQLGQCYHNGSGLDATWISAESDMIPNGYQGAIPDIMFPTIYTGQ